MTLPAMLSPLRAHEARTGAVVVPDWLDRVGVHGHHWWCDSRMGAISADISDDAAELILIGAMAKWLGEQGISVVQNATGFWITLDVRGNQEVIDGHLDNGCLDAHFSACLARLADMPEKKP